MNGRLIVLWLLIICIATGAARKGPKGQNMVREAKCTRGKGFGCTKIRLPVCGSDGVTYANECLLCKEMRESKMSIFVLNEGPC